MIDKIDKPEPPAYKIRATAEAHDRGNQKGQQERREEDEYSASSGQRNWRKYHTDAVNRSSIKLRRRDVAKLFFSQVFLQKGLVIIEADVQLINGHILKHAHLFSTKIDTYWKLKKLKAGDEIPRDQLITGEYVEISVLKKGDSIKTTSGRTPNIKPANVEKKEDKSSWSLWPLIDEKTNKPNWATIIIYTTIIVAIFIAMMMIL